MASPPPQAAGPSGIAQDAKQWSTPLKPSCRPSVNNTKARTQHRLAAKELLRYAIKRDIAELTKLEKLEKVAPEGAQDVHHQTVAEELPTVDSTLKAKLDKQFKKMGGGNSAKERKLYIPGAIILNELTLLWYKWYLKSHRISPPFVIIHLANPDNPLPGDTYNTQCQPDFVSRRATIEQLEDYLERLSSALGKIPDIDDLRPAHGEVVSTVEIKQRTCDGVQQSLNYCSGVIRYRLDQTIAFGLLTAGNRWTLLRLDPISVLYAGTTGTVQGPRPRHPHHPPCQAWYSWNDYDTLLRSLTAIHSAELLRDDTIQYVPGGGQMWRISVKEVQYRVHPFFASYPLGRMTRVGVAYPITLSEGGELPDPVYMKISYVDTNSRFREADLYKQAHSNGYIPGLARLVAHESRQVFVEGKRGQRQKEVVVLGSGGEPLNKCESVVELLKVIYDVIQTLETMVDEGVLHRDISRGNILCKPNHFYHDENKAVRKLPYIDAMLTDDPVSERVTVVALSLVTDLGHSANMSGPTETGRVRLERTGTPMYVSGEIAGNTSPRSEPSTKLLVMDFMQIQKKFGQRFCDTFFSDLVELAHNIQKDKEKDKEKEERWMKDLDALKGMKGLDALNALEAMSASEFSSVLDEGATVPKQLAVQHEPHHDVESVFWVLVGCLVRALPDGDDDKPTDTSNCIFNDMLYHEMPASRSNKRDEALSWTQTEWRKALHPELRMLAPMIARMCQLLCINWRNRSTPSNRFLLHQGFKRLLFMQIREIEKDIRLNTERPRIVYAHKPDEVRRTVVDSSLRASGNSSSQSSATYQSQRPKRGSDSITDPGETTSTRKRPKSDHPAQVTQFTPPNSSAQRFHELLTELNASDEKPRPTPPPLALEIEPIEGPMLFGTEDTVDDDQEIFEGRSQVDVEKKALESVAEALRNTIQQHRFNAESLVKMHLDDGAWHQVTVRSEDAFC